MYRVLLTLAAVFCGLALILVLCGNARRRYMARRYPGLIELGRQIEEAASEEPSRGEHADRPWPPALPVGDDTQVMENVADVFEQEYPIFKARDT